MKYFALFICLFFYNIDVFAANAETTQSMNLGTYVQTATTASGTLSNASAVSGLSGIVVGSSSSKAATDIKLTGTGILGEIITLSVETSTVTLTGTPGCTISIDSFTLSESRLTLSYRGTKNFQVGATVHISGGFCTEGTYHGTGSIGYKPFLGSKKTQEFDISITLEAPLSIEETQGMSFGTFLSPNTNSTIVLSPSGSYTTTGNIGFVDNNLTAGEFTVTGVGNRQVSITLPGSTTLSNGNGHTMTADSFTSTPSGNFTLSGTGVGKTQTVKVGSTLHVNKNQRAGNYTGTYPIIVSY